MDVPEEVRSVEVARVGPDDVIVIKSSALVSRDTASRIEEYCGAVWPGRKVVFLDGSLDVKVFRPGLGSRVLSDKLEEIAAGIDFDHVTSKAARALDGLRKDLADEVRRERALVSPELRVGDKMRFSTELLNRIVEDFPAHRTEVVIVDGIRVEESGEKLVRLKRIDA